MTKTEAKMKVAERSTIKRHRNVQIGVQLLQVSMLWQTAAHVGVERMARVLPLKTSIGFQMA